MIIYGYKAFNQDFTNRYGTKFEVGGVYHANGPINWGKYGNGFHFCTNLEDCFRYFDPETSIITEVKGFGKTRKNDDEYYGYYDMFVCEYIEIVRVVPREEIIKMMLEVNDLRQERFVGHYNLTEEEKKLFTGGVCNERNNYQESSGKQFKKYRY